MEVVFLCLTSNIWFSQIFRLMSLKNKYLIVISGPTAVGKTKMAIAIGQALEAEIISADSRQIYKGMTIGTAVPNPSELASVKHHFIQQIDLDIHYHAGRYESEVIEFLRTYYQTQDIAILCGGTGLYIKAVLYGMDDIPEISQKVKEEVSMLHEKEGLPGLVLKLKEVDPEISAILDLNNLHRVMRALTIRLETGKSWAVFKNNSRKERSFIPIKIRMEQSREDLYDKINTRVDRMMEQGLLEEVKSLLAYSDHALMQTVGYKELLKHLDGTYSIERAVELIKRNSRRYAKRQMTWFRNQDHFESFSHDDIEAISAYIQSQIILSEKN